MIHACVLFWGSPHADTDRLWKTHNFMQKKTHMLCKSWSNLLQLSKYNWNTDKLIKGWTDGARRDNTIWSRAKMKHFTVLYQDSSMKITEHRRTIQERMGSMRHCKDNLTLLQRKIFFEGFGYAVEIDIVVAETQHQWGPVVQWICCCTTCKIPAFTCHVNYQNQLSFFQRDEFHKPLSEGRKELGETHNVLRPLLMLDRVGHGL